MLWFMWMISPTSFLKQFKKKLVGLTREHEALFNFVENNKQICTEKEKQKVSPKFHHYLCIFAHPGRCCLKTLTCLLEMLFSPCSWQQMLNRLSKSAETQVRVDEDYFNINMEGHQTRLKWENTLKNCYQVLENALLGHILLEFSCSSYPEWLFLKWRDTAGSWCDLLKDTSFAARVEPVRFCLQKMVYKHQVGPLTQVLCVEQEIMYSAQQIYFILDFLTHVS